MQVSKKYPVIAWWSGGAASAVTCMLCILWFGRENVRVVFINTSNEADDTYTFMKQCEVWYGLDIEVISNERYSDIEQVWYENLSLNVATGAKCSSELKRVPRENFMKKNLFSYQAFGFDVDEISRAKGMTKNNPNVRAVFPLLMAFMKKKDCINFLIEHNTLFHPLTIPQAYKKYQNNNCLKTMCVQGGIGYWQLVKEDQPEKFFKMAKVEHDLTDKKGEPVTMLKDQSKEGDLVFLLPHPKYPNIKDISMMKGRPPKPLMDCNGFCGTNDLSKNETEKEINFSN